MNALVAFPNRRWLAASLGQGHSGLVEYLVCSPDSQGLAASSSDGTITLWIGE